MSDEEREKKEAKEEEDRKGKQFFIFSLFFVKKNGLSVFMKMDRSEEGGFF